MGGVVNEHRITAATGRPFLVRIVREGERYGLNDCLTHDDKHARGPLVEVYDLTHANAPGRFGERGQFVSRYYVRDFLAASLRGTRGIDLDGGVPVWKLDAAALADACAWIREAIAPRVLAFGFSE